MHRLQRMLVSEADSRSLREARDASDACRVLQANDAQSKRQACARLLACRLIDNRDLKETNKRGYKVQQRVVKEQMDPCLCASNRFGGDGSSAVARELEQSDVLDIGWLCAWPYIL
jgi:hypothetical protein